MILAPKYIIFPPIGHVNGFGSEDIKNPTKYQIPKLVMIANKTIPITFNIVYNKFILNILMLYRVTSSLCKSRCP